MYHISIDSPSLTFLHVDGLNLLADLVFAHSNASSSFLSVMLFLLSRYSALTFPL